MEQKTKKVIVKPKDLFEAFFEPLGIEENLNNCFWLSGFSQNPYEIRFPECFLKGTADFSGGDYSNEVPLTYILSKEFYSGDISEREDVLSFLNNLSEELYEKFKEKQKETESWGLLRSEDGLSIKIENFTGKELLGGIYFPSKEDAELVFKEGINDKILDSFIKKYTKNFSVLDEFNSEVCVDVNKEYFVDPTDKEIFEKIFEPNGLRIGQVFTIDTDSMGGSKLTAHVDKDYSVKVYTSDVNGAHHASMRWLLETAINDEAILEICEDTDEIIIEKLKSLSNGFIPNWNDEAELKWYVTAIPSLQSLQVQCQSREKVVGAVYFRTLEEARFAINQLNCYEKKY